jgi:hypothetical protein
MTINTTLAGLSQTASLNGPDGSADLPSSLDDAIRYSLSFTAMLRDGVGFTAGAIVSGLGFTPVQQGTGTSQLSNAVKIGWSASAQFRIQVDATDFGVNWPINVTGSSASCTGNTAGSSSSCTGNAATATKAATLGNGGSAGNAMIFTFSGQAGSPTYLWGSNTSDGSSCAVWSTSALSVAFAANAGACSGNAATATTASNANALGGLGPGSYITGAGGTATTLRNNSSIQMLSDVTGIGAMFWSASVSDERLKMDIAPTTEDSLALIDRIRFVRYKFRQDMDIDPIKGREWRVGLIAQEAREIDDNWIVDGENTWLQPDQYALLMSAMHAIKQLNAKVAALEAKLGGSAP